MANFLTNLLNAGASSLVDAVGNAIDKNVTSDEERKALDNELAKAAMQHEIEMASIDLKERESDATLITKIHQEQTKVQDSEHASFLAKNVQPFLAISIIFLTFVMFWYIVFSDKNAQILANGSPLKEIVIYILGALTTVATQVVSYYFGSSSGSQEKNKALHKALSKQDE